MPESIEFEAIGTEIDYTVGPIKQIFFGVEIVTEPSAKPELGQRYHVTLTPVEPERERLSATEVLKRIADLLDSLDASEISDSDVIYWYPDVGFGEDS